ncbi:MAG: methyltransferase [Verrucomicrobiales bacterium]|nr:methyltransferase [Verrucomicrobiales bacterium]
MLKHLLPIFPEHTCYCEPFAGGLAVLLAKPRSKVEIVNDLNGDLVALYRCVNRHLPEMLRLISMEISSRENLRDYVRQPGLTDMERATRYYIRNRISFGGQGDSFAVSKTHGGAGFFKTTASELLGKVHDRLEGVAIENTSYERILKNYDSPSTLFFMDPPYVGASPGAYEGWAEEDVLNLVKEISKLQGKFIVTLNDSPFVREAFKDFPMTSHTSVNGLTKNRKNPLKFSELIIRNFDAKETSNGNK